MKKPIEQEAEGSAPDEDEEEAETLVDKIRLRVYEFIRAYKDFFHRQD